MGNLEHRIPPPIVLVLVAVAMWGLARITPRLALSPAVVRITPIGLAAVGLGVLALGFVAFRRARTTIDPVHIEEASALVSGGIFRYTRNPMYVGLTTILLGWAIYLRAPWTLIGPLLFVLFITRFQIIPEERAMLARFGEQYSAYRQRVRRWL